VHQLWGKPAEAIEEARRAIETNPDDPTAVLELGVILAEAGRAGAAREALSHFVAITPPARYERQIADAKQRLAALGP